MNKLLYKIIIPLLLILCIIIGDLPIFDLTAYAASNNDPKFVYDSDGNISLKLMMDKGKIYIWAYSHKASTNIRWETIGFTLTLEPVDDNGESAKGYRGPVAVNEGYDQGHATILFIQGEKKDDVDQGNGNVMTPFVIDEDRIKNEFSGELKNLVKGKTVYLHAIFRTYQIVNENKVLRAGADNGIRNWKNIMNAESWGEDTLGDFYKYYNMPVTFDPAEQENTLYYITEDDINLGHHPLDNKLPGQTVPWSGEPTEKYKKDTNKTYEVIGYKVTCKNDSSKTPIKSLYVGGTVSKSDIIAGSTEVRLGGMNVFLIYREGTPHPTDPPGTPTPTPKVTATPTPKPVATPTPHITPPVTPNPAPPISVERDTPDPKGVINADKYGSPCFDSKNGISTTESQYVYVKTKNYLLGYKLVNRTGKIKYTVPVKVVYTLNYYSATPVKYGGRKPVTDTVSNTWYYPVERAYSYWEVTNLEYYTVNSANVYNYSLPNGGVTLSINSSYVKCPTLSTNHSSSLEDHVLPPKEELDGITINKTLNATDSNRPIIEREDFSYFALTQTGQATVRNDYIMFDDKVVLSNTPAEKIAPKPNVSGFVQSTNIIPDKALYTEGQVVDAKKTNGEYKSTGKVNYSMHPASVNSVVPENSYVLDVNDVTIHTPVICVPVVTADNDKWVQLINPAKDTVQIVLDPDNTLNDFTLSISNTLQHSNRLGYLIRDFSRSFIDPDYISYLAREDGVVRNEVKLPFDVYQDTYNDKNKINDKYIKAGSWIVLGRNTYRFYIPMWVQEGVYTAEFRSIAVNGVDKLDRTEYKKNSEISNYIATSTVNFEISGRIYGLKLYDISDYPKWDSVFRKENTMLFKYFEGAVDGTKYEVYNKDYGYYYAAGIKDQYGKDTGRYSKFTVPLINGDHPQYKNLGVLKKGYAVRFLLDTVGEMYGGLSNIKIMPTFYYVDADGKNRRRVDLYYNETIKNDRYSLVKIGAGIDLVNLKMGPMNNIYNRIPQSEIANTAKVLNTTYAKVADKIAPMYAYSTFRLPSEFRTYIGTDYASDVADLESFANVKAVTGLNSTTVSKYMQRWYGTYKLPEDVHIVEAGYDVYGHLKKYGIDYKENFWLKDGYLIVNFNIITIDARGRERLSYINANNYLNNGNCSMPITEGAVLQKTDNKGAVFNLKAGDFVIYYSDKSYDDDYDGVLY